MRERTPAEVARAVGGRLHGSGSPVARVVVDSRLAGPGALFVALPGQRADGHDFVEDAFARGAGVCVVREDELARRWSGEPAGGALVAVADPGEALLRLAADERAGSAARLVGITGSTGKTSTKDLAAAVLGARYRTVASPASYNNEVGLPLTILSAPGEVEVVVAEMGGRGPGHITRLADVARPDVGVVTNVGTAHMELFGSREAIAEAKAELVRALPPGALAVLPTDDPVARGFARLTSARVLTFGTSPGAAVRAEEVVLDELGRASFTLAACGERARVQLSVAGEHMVANALAAAACGVGLGVSVAECAAALEEASVSPWRMEIFTTADGVLVVNDAYNANPESVAAALRAARWMARRGRLAAVLGKMAELGPIEEREHERVGELAARLRVDRVITVGPEARTVALAAVREGVEPENVASYDAPEEALADVRAWARGGDVVLFKASRVVGLERLAEALRPEGGRA